MHRTHFGLACLIVVLVSVLAHDRSHAATESRDILKSYFETGKIPTEEQFSNLIDSYISLSEDRVLLGLRNGPDGLAELLGEGDTVDASSAFGPASGLGTGWLSQSGYLGLTFEENAQVHYGYLHIVTDADGVGTLYPITIDRFVFENVPGAGLTVAAVPEPSSAALLAGGLILLWGCERRRRRRTI